jgi:hypothetical protein
MDLASAGVRLGVYFPYLDRKNPMQLSSPRNQKTLALTGISVTLLGLTPLALLQGPGNALAKKVKTKRSSATATTNPVALALRPQVTPSSAVPVTLAPAPTVATLPAPAATVKPVFDLAAELAKQNTRVLPKCSPSEDLGRFAVELGTWQEMTPLEKYRVQDACEWIRPELRALITTTTAAPTTTTTAAATTTTVAGATTTVAGATTTTAPGATTTTVAGATTTTAAPAATTTTAAATTTTTTALAAPIVISQTFGPRKVAAEGYNVVVDTKITNNQSAPADVSLTVSVSSTATFPIYFQATDEDGGATVWNCARYIKAPVGKASFTCTSTIAAKSSSVVAISHGSATPAATLGQSFTTSATVGSVTVNNSSTWQA